MDGIENEKSVIVPYSDFTFRQVTTRQPLHMGFKFSSERLEALNHHPIFEKMSDENKRFYWTNCQRLTSLILNENMNGVTNL